MNDTQLETLDQVRQFLEGTETVSFQIESKKARYRWLQHILVKFRYLQLSKTDKGLICRYLRKLTGYSPAQVKRLIRQYRKTGRLERKQRTAKGFPLKSISMPKGHGFALTPYKGALGIINAIT